VNEPSDRELNLRRLIPAAFILMVIAAAGLLWAQEIVREVVVIPISYLIWLVRIFLRSTPQFYCWMVLIVLTFMIAYRTISGRRKAYSPPPEIEEFPREEAAKGRVIYWNIKASMLSMRSGYYQSGFHNALGRLVVEMLAHRYRLTPAQVEERLRNETLDVPEEVREYILNSLYRPIPQPRGFLPWIKEAVLEVLYGWFPGLWQGAKRPSKQSGADQWADPRIARILDYMKEELEVTYDDPSH
jgi:hypothetical protein